VSARQHLDRWSSRSRVVACTVALVLAAGCASDGGGGGGGGSTSMHVGVGYGSYYGPGWYGGYYEPYPPVVVVDPDRPVGDRPDRPTTLPADAAGARPQPAGMASSNRATTAPTRPSNVSRSTSRPSPRPAPRPMPRMGRR
jgi:hypothetical protein